MSFTEADIINALKLEAISTGGLYSINVDYIDSFSDRYLTDIFVKGNIHRAILMAHMYLKTSWLEHNKRNPKKPSSNPEFLTNLIEEVNERIEESGEEYDASDVIDFIIENVTRPDRSFCINKIYGKNVSIL